MRSFWGEQVSRVGEGEGDARTSSSSLGLFPTHHSIGEDDGMGPVSYPQRPGEVECQYYMKTGTCK